MREIGRQIIRQENLLRDGIHGVEHWSRVRENGLRIVSMTGANAEAGNARAQDNQGLGLQVSSIQRRNEKAVL
jgi:hypothetical protein